MNEIGNKIKEVRKRKSLSQEELAEAAKVNLRTIQRIENNENAPSGKTLQLICGVLELNAEDLLDYGKQTDTSYLIYLHLSVLSFLIIPLGNIIIPFILWMTKKDKIIGLKETGMNILNFQILWTLLSYGSIIIFAVLKIMHINMGFLGTFMGLIFSWLIFNVLNILLPIIFAIKVKNGKPKSFYPTIIKLIK